MTNLERDNMSKSAFSESFNVFVVITTSIESLKNLFCFSMHVNLDDVI